MYAIVKSGGKQYRVEAGQTIYVDRLETPTGEKVTLGEVLMVGGADGGPRLGDALGKASVIGTVLEQGRDKKIRVFTYRKRKHYRRTRGHRQAYTALRIESIEL